MASPTPAEHADAYYRELPSHDVDALWKYLGDLLPKEPTSKARAHLWSYRDVRPLLLEAGAIVTAKEAERRVLMLLNPGLQPKIASVTNVYAGLQLVLPGEVAPEHYHAAAALRFVVEGAGGYTTVDGEKAWMEAGDLILTPSWTRHEHGNVSEEPMIWLDGLDLPLINDLEANFLGGPRDEKSGPTPRIKYGWAESEAALVAAAKRGETSATDGVVLPYTQPEGGPIMPTLGAALQLLPSGAHTDAHRHTSSAVYHVVRGTGVTVVDGTRLAWGPRDTFAVPGWSAHEHLNTGDGDAVLFSMSDEPALRALGYYREAPAKRQNKTA